MMLWLIAAVYALTAAPALAADVRVVDELARVITERELLSQPDDALRAAFGDLVTFELHPEAACSERIRVTSGRLKISGANVVYRIGAGCIRDGGLLELSLSMAAPNLQVQIGTLAADITRRVGPPCHRHQQADVQSYYWVDSQRSLSLIAGAQGVALAVVNRALQADGSSEERRFIAGDDAELPTTCRLGLIGPNAHAK